MIEKQTMRSIFSRYLLLVKLHLLVSHYLLCLRNPHHVVKVVGNCSTYCEAFSCLLLPSRMMVSLNILW